MKLVSKLVPDDLALLQRGPEVTSVTCARCAVDYRPRLTAGVCPVCGEVPVDVDPRLLPRPVDADTRMTAIIIATMAANLVVLALLAVAFLGS